MEQTAPTTRVAVPAVRWAFIVTVEWRKMGAESESREGFEKRRQFQFKGPGEPSEGWWWGDIMVLHSCCGLLGVLMV